MLRLKGACEGCQRPLPPDVAGAMICSFECTFCIDCGERGAGICPNCGGELRPRPARPAQLLDRFPAAGAQLTSGFALGLQESLEKLPGPGGQPFAELIRRGTLAVEIFSPQGRDTQQPHDQDELYIVVRGSGRFDNAGATTRVGTGDLLFVAAGVPHHFEDFSDDFAVWVIFYGPSGGEP